MATEYTIHNVDAEDDQLELTMLDRLIIRDRNFKDAFNSEYTVDLNYQFDEPSFKTFIVAKIKGHEDISSSIEIGMEPLARAIRDAILKPEIDLEKHSYVEPVIQEAYNSVVSKALHMLDLLPVDTEVNPTFGQVLVEGVPVAIIDSITLHVSDNPFVGVSIYPATALDAYASGEKLRTQVLIGSHYLEGMASPKKEDTHFTMSYKDGYDKDATPIKPPFDTTLTGEALDQARLEYLNSFKQFDLEVPDIDDDLLDDLL